MPTLTPSSLVVPALQTSPRMPSSLQVESPSVSTPQARARFEFEAGRGNDGTKVLMVEWEDDRVTSTIDGKWTISWEGKPTRATGAEGSLLPATESTTTAPYGDSAAPAESPLDVPKKKGRSHEVETSAGKTHRMYFLLGPKRQVPGIVTLILQPQDSSATPIVWQTNPLPAIFPPGLADASLGSGKGVLHNMWATRRLATLDREIEEELNDNCEGIAFQLALSEKQWIEEKFGLGEGSEMEGEQKSPRHTLSKLQSLSIKPVTHGDVPSSPSSPLSPGGSRLSEKLKGLKLQTPSIPPAENEVAVPICQTKREKLAAENGVSIPPTQTTNVVQTIAQAIPPPAATQMSSNTGMFSIESILSGKTATSSATETTEDEEEELFALPLSPRSPEMSKSPFSWAVEDTKRYIPTQSVS